MKGKKFQDDVKELVRKLGECIDLAHNIKKRSREESAEEPTESSFLCAGRVFEDPPRECPGGPRSSEKASLQMINEDGKRQTFVVCKSCKLAKASQNRKAKKIRKEEKEAEEEEEGDE